MIKENENNTDESYTSLNIFFTVITLESYIILHLLNEKVKKWFLDIQRTVSIGDDINT